MSVCTRHPQADAADRRALGLFADHQVEAEIIRARAAVRLGHGHAQEAALAGQFVDLARHDLRALPLAVAALLADHLALQERTKARAEVFVYVLVQAASHAARDTTGAGSSR